MDVTDKGKSSFSGFWPLEIMILKKNPLPRFVVPQARFDNQRFTVGCLRRRLEGPVVGFTLLVRNPSSLFFKRFKICLGCDYYFDLLGQENFVRLFIISEQFLASLLEL
jgi:hypothetical protein